MSVKDSRVDVRYHMNTGKARHIVKNPCHPHLISFALIEILEKMNRSKYSFNRMFLDCFHKGRYRMEC